MKVPEALRAAVPPCLTAPDQNGKRRSICDLIQLRTALLSTRARTSADAQPAAPSDAIATTRPLKKNRYLMSMDVSPRDEVVLALCREGPHELWRAKLH